MASAAALQLNESQKAEKQARKWKSEIQLSTRREKDWRDTGNKIIDRYRGTEKKRNSFNILWANTEILRPAIYNSRPSPDVRRRFRDADPVGKAVAEVLERGLTVIVDDYSTDCAFKNDVLDGLLCGRGISRVRYVPQITQQPVATPSESAQDGSDSETVKPSGESDSAPESAPQEAVAYEQCVIEHVDWQDFRIGYGRVWEEVMWVAFRCKLTKGEAEEKFGTDALEGVKFTPPQVDDEKKTDVATEVEKQAEFWEVWDKHAKRVFFTQENAQRPLYPLATPNGEPPLNFDGFYPCPMPLIIVENTGSLIPVPIYKLYEQQANELDDISRRINKITAAMKLRGMYDSTLPELADLMSGDDNDLIAVSKAAAWRDVGGLDKAISWMPIEPTAQVLTALNMARDSAKQVIYEITGISDIIRGASVASETATAQQIKANYASVRLKRMQSEVQRYVRDILRLCAEVIAEQFSVQTLAQMTGLQFPTAQQKQITQAKLQMAAQAAQQSGQQPPPPDEQTQLMLSLPTWEDIEGVLKNDALRMYKVDVETDSTVAGSLEGDMQGLSQVIQAIGETLSTFTPLVQMGALPLESAKEIILAVVRRSKLGLAVEDSLEKMQQPPPPPPPPQDNSLQVAQVKAQSDAQLASGKAQADSQVKAAELQAETEREQVKAHLQVQTDERELQIKLQLDAVQKQHDQEMESMRLQAEAATQERELETRRQIADANNQTNLMIAEMTQAHQKEMQAQKVEADKEVAQLKTLATAQPANSDESAPTAADYKAAEAENAALMRQHIESMSNLVPLMTQVAVHLAKPKKVVRDSSGKIQGVE